MNFVEYGQGTPIVLIPGSHGRWEIARPAIDALSRSFRVITFPLCDEPAAACPFDRQRAIESYTAQVDRALDRAGGASAVCGISFGGLIALHAASSRPERVRSLVLVSTPGPEFHLRSRHEWYVRAPWLFAPLFGIESLRRLSPELRRAIPDRRARRAFMRSALTALGTAPPSASRTARRGRLVTTFDRIGDCARVTAPTLVITGEAALDRVVPVDGTLEYARRIAGATSVVLERTGHLGYITRPDAFARIVRDFVDRHHHAAA